MKLSKTNVQGKPISAAAGAPLLLAALFALLCLPPLIAGLPGRDGLAWDALVFHIPQINLFIAQPFDLLDYEAKATTLPFYHVILAQLASWLGIEQVDNASLVIRLAHFLLSSAGILAALLYISARTRFSGALLLGLPLVTSWYIVSGAIFFGTDGPGLSLALIALILLLNEKPVGLRHATAFLAVTATRHLMLPYVVGTALWKGFTAGKTRAALVLAPAVLLLLLYVVLWGGLTPPGMVAQLNPGGIFIPSLLGQLAIAGLWGTCYGLIRLDTWRRIAVRRGTVRIALAAAASIIFLLWLTCPTDFAPREGRFGSIAWYVAGLIMIGDHSIPVLILAMLGASAIILCAVDCLDNGLQPLEMAGLALFLVGLMLTYAAYQRYSEPLCIASFAIAISRLPGRTVAPPLAMLPLLALSCLGLARYWQGGLVQQLFE